MLWCELAYVCRARRDKLGQISPGAQITCRCAWAELESAQGHAAKGSGPNCHCPLEGYRSSAFRLPEFGIPATKSRKKSI